LTSPSKDRRREGMTERLSSASEKKVSEKMWFLIINFHSI
jgi:hypothetical protein